MDTGREISTTKHRRVADERRRPGEIRGRKETEEETQRADAGTGGIWISTARGSDGGRKNKFNMFLRDRRASGAAAARHDPWVCNSRVQMYVAHQPRVSLRECRMLPLHFFRPSMPPTRRGGIGAALLHRDMREFVSSCCCCCCCCYIAAAAEPPFRLIIRRERESGRGPCFALKHTGTHTQHTLHTG